MTTCSSLQPILRRKPRALDVQDLEGLLRVHLAVKDVTPFSGFYTRIDQVFLVWGSINDGTVGVQSTAATPTAVLKVVWSVVFWK